MHPRYCCQFFEYCQLADFSMRFFEALTVRLKELVNFLKTRYIRGVKKVRYRHPIDFTADCSEPSLYVTKYRGWTLRQFYHFLTVHRIVCHRHTLSFLILTINRQTSDPDYTLDISHCFF